MFAESCFLWLGADPLFSQLFEYWAFRFPYHRHILYCHHDDDSSVKCRVYLLMGFCVSLQFDPSESYQPASLQLIKEALKMPTPSKNLQAVSRAQSEGNVVEGKKV